MENSTKALLIAAAILIVILLISISMAILSSAGDSFNEAKQVGNAISSLSKDTADKIIQSNKNNSNSGDLYEITVIFYGEGCYPDSNNPSTIKENGTAILKFYIDMDREYLGYQISGAKYQSNYNPNSNPKVLEITISNPTEKVKINIYTKTINTDDNGEGDGAGAEECCFVAGTQVLLADGTTKNIEDVEVGDKVLSYNETTNEYEEDEVIGLITNPNTINIARITLVDGTKIEMNEYHPIYTEDGWHSLTNHENLPTLTKEDKVLSTNGEFKEILSIEQWTEEEPILSYNLIVKNNHNYFVGETPILAHNASCTEPS